ncbi:MAG: hypothetical protein COT88_01715 [Candidatus Colwellbacteria bacterium CG10_big_fil_rev_8_21_14_0_10_41_28]|uniref:Transcription elongation factor GreA/GreB C-terminal domain-containing protein n=1 Tax=Candidatus Colwellbacteria bacterium CG10_big_fil_rev_8_21_14_0_10_41_28 TaxID=1974539 RepID=A0A2H0VH34_9BACT|nr:MAG: hypothetical protein COT88_01715 [Candidatus Colwellbacteria bacterium CG10_big_fil_rev_8_21_14_0_10_41_28]
MRYKFLQKDAAALEIRKQELFKEREFLAKDAALHVSQSSESWHDNAGFEVSLRQQSDLAKRIDEVRKLEGNIEIVEPSSSYKQAGIGSEIEIKDLQTGETSKRTISSYRVFDKIMNNEIPYSSPIGSKFLNTRVGSTQRIMLPGREVQYQLISVSPSGGLIKRQ